MEEMQAPQPVEQPAQPSRVEILKKLSPSLLWAGVIALLFSVPGAGFGVVFIIIPQIILIPIRLYMAIMKPVDRWLNLGRVFIWLAAIATIYAVHHVREDINRKYADEVVARIEAYSAANGKCAAHIEDVGISAQEMHDNLGLSAYRCEEGKQYFIYRGSFEPFSIWHYDFENRSWHYRPD